MIMTIAKLREYITTTESDDLLKDKLEAIEQNVRKYTNNNFQDRNYRATVDAYHNNLFSSGDVLRYVENDTIQISESKYNNGLYTVDTVTSDYMTLKDLATLIDETDILITKVVYPQDVKIGVVNLLNWELNNRDKVGIQSETISRHSVTYFNMDVDNSLMGYPRSLMGFLKPYRKPKF